MLKRINSTGRRRIERRHVRFDLRPGPEGRLRIQARFDLADLRLDRPAEARIIVEAYRQNAVERFDFGTTALPAPQGDTALRELDATGLQLRVKLVEPGTGRLLASGDRLFSNGRSDDRERRELFRVVTRDIGQELWKVEIDPVEAPTLVLNKEIGNPHGLLSDRRSRAAILPGAMRIVLLRLWMDGREVEPDDTDDWSQRWFGFAEQCSGEERPAIEAEPEMIQWIDAACAGFARQFGLVDAIIGGGGDA